MNIEDKKRYSIAKIRNIVYYRLYVDEKIEDRFRGQYMHVLRQYRKDTLLLLAELDQGDPTRGLLQELVGLISPKVKTNECLDTIERIEGCLTKYGVHVQ